MKKLSIFKIGMIVVCMACGLSITSCSGNGELTKGNVEDELERLAYGELNFPHTVTLKTGYYEENSASARMELRQLASLGLVTYKAENILEITKSRYWGTKKKDHIFVTVALTEEGKKFVMTDEEKEKMREKVKKNAADQDMVNPNEDTEYPEDKVPNHETIPVVDDDAESPAGATSTMTATVGGEGQDYMDDDYDGPYADKDGSSYSKALAKVSYDNVSMKAFNWEIYKVRNIYCTTNMLEEGKAEAEVIFEYVDVTPFGRVMSDKKEGEKMKKDFQFVKYTDGWKLK